MVIGFTILNSAGHEEAILKFIKKVCILEDDKIANNIVSAGDYVNVYAKGLTEELLAAQNFDCSPIKTLLGSALIVSNVDYILELPYDGQTLRLLPTGYSYIPISDVSKFDLPLKQNLIKIFSEGDEQDVRWILRNNKWDDFGWWVDTEEWND